MASMAAVKQEAASITACTVSRDVQNFDLLIEDMEAELGESWGDLGFAEATMYFQQPEADSLEFIAIALDAQDEPNMAQVRSLIQQAREKRIRVILIAEELSPIVLHQLLRLGADDFVPYPLPEGALHEAIERLRQPAAPVVNHGGARPVTPGGGGRDGVVLPVQGLAGGVGATTFAVNLAWELANIDKKDPPKVCLIDLDLQTGSVSTYLDLPRREAIYEALSNTAHMDHDALMQAMLTFNEKLSVFTAPADMLPLDLLTCEDVETLIDIARENFDFVLIDMPTTVVQWTETVLHKAHIYFALIELDMRSAQNTLRLLRALKAEELPHEKLRFALNRAPRFTDLSGKSRAKRMAESLDIDIELMLPDGAAQVTQANDHGLPLSEVAAKNVLLKEINRLAKSLYDLNKVAETSET